MKKIMTLFMLGVFSLMTLCSCNIGGEENTESKNFEVNKEITVISREEGAGLRGVVAQLFDFLDTKADNAADLTFSGASIKESADDIRTAVANDTYAIGYLPLTAVTDNVKTLKIDGVEPTADNVRDGDYKFKHKISAVVKQDVGAAAQDFINYILSTEGQKILSDDGYISFGDSGSFTSKNPEGTIKISVAASAEPAVNKLSKAYGKINKNLKIEITKANAKNALDSVKDKDNIAILTRTLSNNEKKSFNETTICEDGIAVIVNRENSLNNITAGQVKSIYKGETKKWSDIIK